MFVYQFNGSMKLSILWYRRVCWKGNEAESYLFIDLQHHFHRTLLKLFQCLMWQTLRKEVINRRSVLEGINNI